MSSKLRGRVAPVLAMTALTATMAACGGADAGQSPTGDGGTGGRLSGTIKVDGSSTVAPLSTVAAELFQKQNSGVRVTVGTSGTGGGFEKFCRGETDISDASRPIKDEEKAECEKNGVAFEEFAVANDALTVVVNKENNWATCLTVDQLKKIWEPGSKVSNWRQVDPSFPNEPLKLFGPGTDSGTFDYFTDEINGTEGASRTDYAPSEDDNITVQGVAGSKGGLGYFGFSYFEENANKLKALQINGGDGCVAPSAQSVQDGSYKPLGRPLFIYPSAKALDRPEAEAFVEYYVANHQKIAEDSLFIPLNAEQEKALQAALEKLKSRAGS